MFCFVFVCFVCFNLVEALNENVKFLFGQFDELKALVSEVASLSGILETTESDQSSGNPATIGSLESVQARIFVFQLFFTFPDAHPTSCFTRMRKQSCHEQKALQSWIIFLFLFFVHQQKTIECVCNESLGEISGISKRALGCL